MMPDPSMLEGRLVRLRAREPEDEPHFYRWINDEAVSRYLLVRYPYSHRQERGWLDDTNAPAYGHVGFAVETRADAQLIGQVTIRNASSENRSAELALMLGERSLWGHGYGGDTIRVACRFGFEMMNLHSISLEVFAEHERAIALYSRLGFSHDGRRRHAVYKFGRYHDLLVMSLLEGELREDE